MTGGADPATSDVAVLEERTRVLRRRVRLVVAATITYNVVEAVIAISAGMAASSAALVGFGLDSTVEVISAAAIAWQFAGRDHETRERTALRIVAFSFFALAAYVTFDAVRAFAGVSEPEHSTVGIVLAAVSLAVMPLLSWFERRTGRELGSASVVADSKQTLICSYLSAVLLVGLVLNSAFGLWWADPIAALAIAGFAVREGLEAWRGDACGASASALLASPDADLDAGCGDGCTDGCCRA
ncbi:cation transporter, partial [Phytoactinopolyspora endophytica]|uniref:cation transporter n=1 Tax=Phytoactinopolyspora endophytica TaxID=1642495 RepID=UPI00101CC215